MSKITFTIACMALICVSCTPKDSDGLKARQTRHQHAGTSAKTDEHNTVATADKNGLKHDGHDHDGHSHDAHETSDLDRPVDELFAAECEHHIKTYRCDACRYEVGVVKAVASLFSGGLLTTGVVERRAFAKPLALTGEVRFDDRRVAHVSTQVEGIIKRVHVTLGDRVKRGQPLMAIESVVVGDAQAEYFQARGLVTLATRNYDRLEALRKEGIASEKELLKARQALDTAQIRADAALGKLRRLGMHVPAGRFQNQSSMRGRLVLRAPSDGTVLNMHAVSGEVARADTPLATVGDNSAVWVWADLYERHIALVTRKQAKRKLDAAVTVRAFPTETFYGKVDFISPSMSELSRTVKARIAVPNPKGRLLAGMFAQVQVFIPEKEQILAVPRSALLEDEGRAFIFIHYTGDYWVRRPVVAGRTFAQLTEITQGLKGGETIVVNGAFLLKSDVLRSKMGAGCAD